MAYPHRPAGIVNNFPNRFSISRIRTLGDALELAHELEGSEVNVVFQAVIGEFMSIDSRARFVLSMVDQYLSRLHELSQMVSPEERKYISA